MGEQQEELEYEQRRLRETVALAKAQLEEAQKMNDVNEQQILEAKRELRENSSHAIGNLWSSEEFEALAELNQYTNCVTNKIADYEAVEHKIMLLQGVINSPYFARVDFRFQEEEVPEQIYIGRTSLKQDNSYEMNIYDWRSPIASVFYRFMTGKAYYDAPGGRIDGEISLKRQYEIINSQLEYFFDAEVQIVDEFLRKLLSQNTSLKMKTIVETIQKEQDVVIRDMENDLMMVQGAAGSGKTSIALHRAAYLMYQGLTARLEAQNILVLSPNLLFEQYISDVLPELGESNVVSAVFEEIASVVLHRRRIQSRNHFLERMITEKDCRDRMKRSIEFKTSDCFRQILDRFVEDLPLHGIPFEDIYDHGRRILGKEALKRKILGRKETPVGVKLKQLEELIIEKVRESQKTRTKKEEEIAIREEIHRFTELNLQGLYRSLIRDRAYFEKLSEGLDLPERTEEILEWTQSSLGDESLPYEDAIALTYLSLRVYGNSQYKEIRQVVIDEAQDYYPLQYEIFRLLFPKAKFTVLGDMNQTLEKEEDLSVYENISHILKRKKSVLVTMDKSFRCTNEILKYSLQFIHENQEIKSFNRSGEKPEVFMLPDRETLYEKLVQEIQHCKALGFGTIALLCKSEENARELYAGLKAKTELRLIGDEETADLKGVFVLPIYLSKGLEFDAAQICDADAETYTSGEDRKFLYIACTRALHRLNLFCCGEISPLL